MKKSVLAIGAAAGMLLGAASPASAALIYELNTVYTGPGTPSGTAPWVTLTFVDVGSTVELTIQANLQAAGEYIDDIGISYSGPGTPILNQLSKTGTFDDPVVSTSNVNFQGGQTFNISFDYENSNSGGGSKRFDANDSVTFSINVDDLSYFDDLLAGNDYYVAAHIGGLGPNNELSGTITGTPIPEPSTVIAGTLLLLPFAASTLRRFMRK